MAESLAFPENAPKKGQGRPRSFDLEAALQTAQTLFQQKGYAGVSTVSLCEAIGISPPSLYSAFGSKGRLFGRVVERYVRTEAAFIADALLEPTAGALVERLLSGAAVAYAARGAGAGCLVMNGPSEADDPVARTAVAEVRAALSQQINEALARHAPGCAGQVAELLGIALAGMSAAARDGANRDCLNRFAQVMAGGLIASFDLR